MKRTSFSIILLIVLVSLAATGCSDKKRHADNPYISVVNFASDDLLVCGSYNDLIQRMGPPTKQYVRKMQNEDATGEKTIVSVPMLQYGGVVYCRRDDSVQLTFIDLQKCGKQLTFQLDDAPPLSLDSTTLCDTFYDYLDAQLYHDDHLKAIPDEEKLSFEPHYNVDGLYYAVSFCSNCNNATRPSITPVFLPQTRKLWYIEFSPFDSRGLYRKTKK